MLYLELSAGIILNLIFIPIYGFIGAAIAIVMTEIIFFFMYISFIVKYGLGIKFIRIFIRPVISAAIMVCLLSFIENIFVGVILGGSIYFIALFVFGTIDKEDRLLFNKVIKNI